jgi:Cu+-exporting ATPase
VSTAELIVVACGAVLILAQLWIFLAPRSPGTRTGSRAQEIRVVVNGEFQPSVITVDVGRPVRLLFYREETASRSNRVTFDRPPMSQNLTSFQTTAVEFTPTEAGDYPFRCGSIKGLVAAQVGGEAARLNLGRGHANHG